MTDEPVSSHVLRGRIGGNARVRNIDDMDSAMQAAWRGRAARWERLVDPDGVLPPDIRARKAKAAEREHMARLALRRHKAAKLRREAAQEEAAADSMAAELAVDAGPGAA